MFYTGTQWMVRFSRIRSNRIGFSEAIFVSDGIGLRDWSFGLDYLRIHVVGESSYFRLPIEGAMTSASRGWQAGIGVCPILSPELHFSHLKTIKDTFKFQILPDAAWVISFGKKKYDSVQHLPPNCRLGCFNTFNSLHFPFKVSRFTSRQYRNTSHVRMVNLIER